MFALSNRRLAIRVAAVAFSAISSISAAQSREMTYANHLPPAHPVNKAMDAYFDQVTQDTGGDLTFKTFYGGALGGGNALISILRDGLTDSGFVNPVYDPTTVPVEAALSELMHPDPRVLVGAMNEMVMLHCPKCRAELKAINAIPMMSFATSSFHLVCNKPIKSAADAGGTKVRAVGALALLVTQFDMVPVNLKSDETYEGLQRGQIDCAIVPLDWLTTNHLEEVATDVISTPLGSIGGLLHDAINTSVWEQLDAPQRKALIGRLGGALADMTFAYMQASSASVAAAEKTGKVEVYPMSADLTATMKAFQESEVQRIVAKTQKNGIADADKIFDVYTGLLEKWEKIVATVGDDQAKYAKALNDNIYSNPSLQ